jgi:hypothetical protein
MSPVLLSVGILALVNVLFVLVFLLGGRRRR